MNFFKYLKCLLMADCQDCKKITINNCGDCDYTVNTDCVEYKGDRLSFESSSVRNNSTRTLTSILESLDAEVDCLNVNAKIIQGDYEIISEDTCKFLLLDGDVNAANVTYTITLPDSEDFYNKTIIIKDISSEGSPSGKVSWEFDSAIQYSWNPVLTTVELDRLFSNPHRLLYLTFLKTDGVNYSWVVTSPSVDYPEKIVIEDTDMVNSWSTQASSEVKLYRTGLLRKLDGLLTDGTKNTTAFTLEAKDRPANDLIFMCPIDASPYLAVVNILTTGAVQISLPGYVGATVSSSDSVSLSNCQWYVD